MSFSPTPSLRSTTASAAAGSSIATPGSPLTRSAAESPSGARISPPTSSGRSFCRPTLTK
eukprot:9495463-Alexandrium_andersonii.AAC.1